MSFTKRAVLSFVLIWIGSILGVAGAPVNNNQDTQGKFRRQAGSFAITGAPVIDGQIPQRLEIRQLRKNQPQWNLYLLALNRFEQMDHSDVRSYYQLSGIHGRPFTEWDGVPMIQDMGYCSHTSNLFATWHRPYIVAFEQVLYGIVQEVATSIANDTNGEYKEAALTFRHPYWDWAAPASDGGPVLPAPISGSAYIVVHLPNGSLTISNPLYQYNFHSSDLSSFPDPPFNEWKETLRYPSAREASASSQNKLVGQQITQSQDSYAQRFVNLLQAYPRFANFSSSAWTPNSPGYDSLESLHNQIHGLIGNGGHMAVIDYAGFDPLFWLHHANVDRLLAIWQALHPNSYVEPSNEPIGSAAIAQGTLTDVNTPLKPFHNHSNGNFWTSATVADITSLGYSYPEIQGKSVSQIKAAVNALYASSSGVTIARRGDIQGHDDPNVAPIVAAGLSSDAPVEILPSPPASGNYTEWLTNIRVAKDALEQTFFIHIFLGDFNPDPKTWSMERNLVGTHAIMTPYVMKRDPLQSTIVTGQIPLTRTLRADEQRGLLDMKNEGKTKDYLTRHLHWRVTTMDDKEVPRDKVPELKISVVAANVQAADADDVFPVWGELKVRYNGNSKYDSPDLFYLSILKPKRQMILNDRSLNRSLSVRSKKSHDSPAEKSGPKHRFTMASLRGIQQPELSKKLFKIIKSENHAIGAYESASRERISIASQISDWGEATGDDSISDVSDKIGVLLSEMGEQEDLFAQNLEDYRSVLKQIRNTESSVQPSRDQKAKITDEIQRLKYKEPQSTKLVQLEQELVRAEAQNLVAEAQTRQKLKEAYDIHSAAVIERAEKQILLSRHMRRLIQLLDDTPVVPGDVRPAFEHSAQARQILNDAEDDLREWQPSMDPIPSSAADMGTNLMPPSTTAESTVNPSVAGGGDDVPAHLEPPEQRDVSGSTMVQETPAEYQRQ
ncbi:MAG: hypothetical protein LQ348_004192 [Seirophora lacunosa]|nr:MAG: hypothetical protein LQ348_004192 [Seirophora lacunosa]